MDIILTKLFAHHPLCLPPGLTNRDRELLERIRRENIQVMPGEKPFNWYERAGRGLEFEGEVVLGLCKYLSGLLSLSLSLFSLLARFWDRTAWGLNIPINSNVTRMKCQHQHTCTSHTGITSGNFVRKLSSSRNILFNKWLTTPSEYSSYQAGPFSPPSSQLKSKGSQEFEALKVSTFFLMQF